MRYKAGLETRERILGATRTLVAANGLDGTTIKAICELAGVLPGSFYNLFASKEQAVLTVVREAIDAVDVPTLTEAGLAARPLESWPSMRLVAAPWVRLWTTRRSYPELFEARRLERSSPDPVPPPDGGRHHVLVWRQDLEVLHRSVRGPEARALAAMLAGDETQRDLLLGVEAVGGRQLVQRQHQPAAGRRDSWQADEARDHARDDRIPKAGHALAPRCG